MPQKVDASAETSAQIAARSLPNLKPAVGFDYEGRYQGADFSQSTAWQQQMSLGLAAKTCFKKYFTLRGRASRAEYWYFQLFQLLVALGVVGFVFMMAWIASWNYTANGQWTVVVAVIAAYGFIGFYLATVFPNISVLVRRLHDVGQSGWMYWLSLIPFVGGVILLVFALMPSQQFRNQFD